MARCFDVPVVASLVAAQILVVLFAPAVLILQLPTVFCLTPGNAVVYAPYMVALGLLGRLEPASWRSFALTAAAILGLLLYSIYCDPLWSMVNGISWSIAFAVVTFGPLRIKTVITRCAALACSLALLVASRAAQYLYTLSQYTARVQFAQALDRAREPALVSTVFHSPSMKYYYSACAVGWLLGLGILRTRSRLFVAAGAVSCIVYVVYSVLFLLLNRAWALPLPQYVEQCLFPLFVATAAAGYWGALRAAGLGMTASVLPARGVSSAPLGANSTQSAGRSQRPPTLSLVQRMRITAIRHGMPGLAHLVLLISRPFNSAQSLIAPHVGSLLMLSDAKPVPTSGHVRSIALVVQMIAAAAIPVYVAYFALNRAQPYARVYYERRSVDPELSRFLDKLRQVPGQPFRGSVLFWQPDYPALQAMVSAWQRGIPSVNEYSQLVTPQELYFIHVLLKKDIRGNLNWFQPFFVNGTYTEAYWVALQMFGTRYFVGYSRLSLAEDLGFSLTTLPHGRIGEEPDTWNIYELPHANLGGYSPTEAATAGSGAEIMAIAGKPEFDATRQVVLLAPVAERLVPAREMGMSRIRGGLHLSGHSEGTSLVVLPQQFSNCLRARDQRVRLVRANLMMTGLIFSGDLDTDIDFDYGIFTPNCRSADLADMKQLDLRIDLRMTHLSDDRLLPGWNEAKAKMKAIAAAIK
jgi:hypothetical protein